ncbi:unnamed protein product [Discosporangium mesarthrocarpum]
MHLGPNCPARTTQVVLRLGCNMSSESFENDPVVKLAVDLINVQSLSGFEQHMADFLVSWLAEKGWIVERQEVAAEQRCAGGMARHNIFAYRPKRPDREGGPRVLFNSHIDTVPPYFPAELSEEDGVSVVKGRGACDTKGILAAQLTAVQSLVERGVEDIGILYVVSEETDHSGMLKANELGLDPEYLIVGEPTGSKMMRLQKGMLKLRILMDGVACHSGYPHLGKSAIDCLVEALRALKNHCWPSSEELGETTLNIGLVQGGQAANALAEHAEATLMFRLTEAPEGVLETVRSMVEKEYEGTVEVISQNAPVSLEVLPGFETDVAAYNTDIPYFKLKSGCAFLYGPGTIHDAHSMTEKIGVHEIKSAVEAYQKIARTCLGLPEACQ